MSVKEVDVVIVGAGPVGLMCSYLGQLCGLSTLVVDKSDGPLKVGRADALNARTLQLLEVVGLFDELYPLGKPCNTSSVWADGKFVSRQSSWWEDIEGCFHKHFLMIGQCYVEGLLDRRHQDARPQGARLQGARLKETIFPPLRSTSVENIEIKENGCVTTISNGEKILSHYVIGADGSRSFVRDLFKIPFSICRPQIVWAVIDGVIETDFQKVPEIIVFQAETSDVAWIPREGIIDRFYVRMDTSEFTFEDAMSKIHRAMRPHSLKFTEVEWYSKFTVKESVAENFSVQDRVFLAGDACHIHSVNGGQGLNTGLADAFNLMWKLNMVLKCGVSATLLQSYESERKPVAQSVIESSGELVRSTKYSDTGTHAQDYVKIVERRAGNITGMGICYGDDGPRGTRLFDLQLYKGIANIRLYSLLKYTHFTLIIFGDPKLEIEAGLKLVRTLPAFVKVIQIHTKHVGEGYWVQNSPYLNQAVLVRPDSYIESVVCLDEVDSILSSAQIEISIGKLTRAIQRIVQ